MQIIRRPIFWFATQVLLVCGLFYCPTTTVYAADPQVIEQLIEEGASLLRKDSFDDALKKFNRVLLIDPNNGEVHFRLGQLYFQKRDVEKGLSYLEKSTKLEPKNVRFSLNLALVFERQGKMSEAITEYRRLISTGTRDKRLKEAEKRMSMATGRVLGEKGEFSAALLIFNGLLLEYPDDAEVLFYVGGAYVQLNRIQEAETTYKKLSASQPSNALVRINLANIYERTGRNEDALRELQAIIGNKEAGELGPAARVRHALIIAREKMIKKDWNNAIEAFRRVEELEPKNPEAEFNIALANVQLGRTDVAIKIFEKILEAKPGDFSVRLNLGQIYYDSGKPEQSKAQFQYVIDNDKDGRYRNQASARMNVIHTLIAEKALQQGNVEEGLRQYQKALDYFSGNIKASFNRGLIFVQQKKWEEARAEFESVIKYDPTNLRGRLNLANIYEQLSLLTKAAEQYEQILQIDRNSEEGRLADAKWRITKARGLWTDLKLTDAEKLLEEIVHDQSDNIEAYYYLGTIQQSKSKLREAARSYQKILDIRPDNQQVHLLIGNVYEMLELEELAAQEYRTIIFAGGVPAVVQQAQDRLDIVESRLSGFSSNMSFQFNYDGNINMYDLDPREEVRSDLSFNVMYAQKVLEDASVNLTASPSYSTFHNSQFDSFRTSFQGAFRKGNSDRSWSVQFGRQDQQGLLTQQRGSSGTELGAALQRRHFMQPAFGWSPSGFRGEDISTDLNHQFSLRSIKAVGETPLETLSASYSISGSQGLRWGLMANASYSLAVSRNLSNAVANRTTTVPDPVTNLPITSAVLTYDSKDYEYNSHSLSASGSRTLAPGLRGSLSLNAAYTGYVNVDSSSRIAKGNATRNNITFGANVTLIYGFFKDINFFGSAGLQKSMSSLPVGLTTVEQKTGQAIATEAVSTFQSNSLGSFTRPTLSAGLSMSF